MKGDEDKCLAAGMDAYLSKPIDGERLDACLQRFLTSTDSTRLPEPNHPPAGERQGWDALLQSIDGDHDFARELVNSFIVTSDRELVAIEMALRTGDLAALRESAHTLKGASASLHSSAVAVAAAELEAAASAGNQPQIAALAGRLGAEVRKSVAYLRSMTERSAP